MSARFFVETPISAAAATLRGAEAHHLAHVMRAEVGTAVTLFDGSGAEFRARVAKVGRSTIDLDVISREEVNRELPHSLTLGVALPKGDRQRWLVEKATELGVTRIVPLKTSRGVAQPGDEARERLGRTVIEASKQCGRNRLVEIAAAVSLAEYAAAAPREAVRWLAHPGGVTPPQAAPDLPGPTGVWLAIGPEGGFTDEEVAQALASGWQAVSLGPRILRVETAALALAARCSL